MLSKLLTHKNIPYFLFAVLFLVQSFVCIAQTNYSGLNLDTIKAGKFDTGKMWTFEQLPVDYFKDEYNFSPGQQWYDHLRLSALKFADYCSASFVSEDGLIMTNHHCARESVTGVIDEDEDLHTNGFIAESLDDERPVPGLYVEQLVMIKDVTKEIHEAIEMAGTDSEKYEAEHDRIAEIEERVSEESGLTAIVTPLYNGAKYSVYCYKRYEDVRLVFSPEAQLGSFGGDYDNFTYPRYNLDCAFFRAYDEDGNPLKIKDFLKWSLNGADEGEAVFVVGNPGSTDRLKTIVQLEYMRDFTYPLTIGFLQNVIDSYNAMIAEDSTKKAELNDQLLSFQNSLKAYSGMLDGLKDPVLMQRKKDFENNFRNAVLSDEKLKDKYGDIWKNMEALYDESNKITEKFEVFDANSYESPEYFYIAEELLTIAEELKYPEDERSEYYKGDALQSTIESLMPSDFNYDHNKLLLKNYVDKLYENLGEDNELVKEFTDGNKGEEAVDYILENSSITTQEDIQFLVKRGSMVIENSDDPFIKFVIDSRKITDELSERVSELAEIEESYNRQLGKALFEVYGNTIPPDATFTLRLSDGVVQSFEYNGTIAPVITTFNGLYDRYYSFDKKYPWNLPERWINPPVEFDLSTPFNFISTNDLTGGSSGSPVVNKNSEIVGVSFDGNIQGLPGSFIYRIEDNRTISVHSKGMIEALKHIYKFERLVDELLTGKMKE